MALAVNRTGVIFKKCDMSNHRPETVKQCVSGICQHTCQPDTIEKCKHAWTLRYWVNGKQVEKSFKDKQHPATGRVDYGSGKKFARDWQLPTLPTVPQAWGWSGRCGIPRPPAPGGTRVIESLCCPESTT